MNLFLFFVTLCVSDAFVTSSFRLHPETRLNSATSSTSLTSTTSTYPFSEQELITRAKEIIAKDVNFGVADGGECLADNFKFIAAAVGPLNKKDYLSATVFSLDLLDQAMELSETFFGFHGDPEYPNRVWFMTRQQATHSKGPFAGAKPSGETLLLPPQTMHLDFDENLKVTEYGLYTVDRNQGNTGGLGGLLGYFYGVGRPLPYPEGQPYKMSWQMWLINKTIAKFPSQSEGMKIESLQE